MKDVVVVVVVVVVVIPTKSDVTGDVTISLNIVIFSVL